MLTFFTVYGSEEPITGITNLPPEVIKNILENVPKDKREALKLVNKEFYDLIVDIEKQDSYIHYIARTNLFNKKFDLADSERRGVKNLMQDPVFF